MQRAAILLLSVFFAVLTVQGISMYDSLSSFDGLTSVTASTPGHAASAYKAPSDLHVTHLRRRSRSDELTFGKERLAHSMIPAFRCEPPQDFSFVVVQDANEPSPPSIHLPADTRPPCLSA